MDNETINNISNTSKIGIHSADNITTIDNDYTIEKVLYLIYFIQGLFMFMSGITIFFPIMFHDGLRSRKEYVFIGALSVCDSMNGLGYIIAGSYRFILYTYKLHQQVVTKMYCFLHPANILWNLFEMSSPIMLLVISLDRLILVHKPLWHNSQGLLYALLLILPVIVHAMVYFAIGVYLAIVASAPAAEIESASIKNNRFFIFIIREY